MSSPSEVLLTADAHAVAVREITAMYHAVKRIGELVQPNQPLDTEQASMMLNLLEHYHADIGKALGLPTESESRIQERSAMLRTANARIAELEKLQGSSIPAEQLLLNVRQLAERVNIWWRQYGFGLVNNLSISDYSCTLQLSCSLFGDFVLIGSDTPATDKIRLAQWHDSLRSQGMVLAADGRTELDIVDCDQSRAAVMALIHKYLPSAKCWTIENRARRDGRMKMASMTLHVSNLGELSNLPGETS